MARPDLSEVTSGLARARASVAEAKTKVSPDAVPHLDAVDTQLQEAQARLEDALTRAADQRGE